MAISLLGRQWVVIGVCLALASNPAFGQQDSVESDSREQSSFAIPIVVVESPEQSSRAFQREQSADAHDADDLNAQWEAARGAQRAATSAERQEIPTLAVAILGTIIAAIAVALSLWSARRADTTARTQLRAYLQTVAGGITRFDSDHIEGIIGIKNTGQTPARNVSVSFKFHFTSKGNLSEEVAAKYQAEAAAANLVRASATIGGSSEVKHYLKNSLIPANATIRQRFDTKDIHVSLVGVVVYDDVFGRTWKTHFDHHYESLKDGFLHTTGNHAT